MKEHLSISSKGQITLPAAMRQALGLAGQAIVTAEIRHGRIVLAPAVVVETEIWTDADVAAWDAADTFAPGEHKAIAATLAPAAHRRKGTGRSNGPGRG